LEGNISMTVVTKKQPTKQSGRIVDSDFVGNNDSTDKTVIGSSMHALGAQRNFLPARLPAELNPDTVSIGYMRSSTGLSMPWLG